MSNTNTNIGIIDELLNISNPSIIATIILNPTLDLIFLILKLVKINIIPTTPNSGDINILNKLSKSLSGLFIAQLNKNIDNKINNIPKINNIILPILLFGLNIVFISIPTSIILHLID